MDVLEDWKDRRLRLSLKEPLGYGMLLWLDSVILKVFSNLNDSMIL